MDRRETLKLLLLSAVSSRAWLGTVSATAQPPGFASDWDQWPDMRWAGPAFWGNRLQDWELESGVVTCRVAGPNRTLHCLTRRLSDTAGDFLTRVDVAFTDEVVDGYVGFRVGAKGRNVDYRSAAVFGEGLDAGVTAMGELFIGDVNRARAVDTTRPLTLELEASPQAGAYRLTLTARAAASGDVVDRLIRDDVASSELSGNVALVSHLEGEGRGASFAGWRLEGSKILADDDAVFGPIAFAQYTVHRDTLKLTAQLMPLESLGGVEVTLEVRNDSETSWRQLGRASIDPLSRTIRFRIDGFREDRPLPYRVRLSVPLASGRRDFFYEGTIAEEPALEAPLRAAVFSCNADHGFPDTEVVENVSRHRPDLAIFLGDQFYESSGGFGIQTAPLDDACLDMLRKWYLFGWSYRNIFRHVPAAFLPDDHDVYHGNIWGEGGKEAPTDRGFGAEAQDRGGYKMDPEWVNVVQRCQMSHLPDPFDPTPAERGIDVYYTGWDYGGVSFALLEDRKFKSAPANVLPQEAQVFNGWIQNRAFDIREHRDPESARLLGERQLAFLERWSRDWSGTHLKVVLSQTNFASVHTIPEGEMSGAIIPSLPMPEPGAYVSGDKRTADLDTNGWPQTRRDEVLRVLRRCSAFHIAGDQHLATVVRHGIEAFDDAGFSFTVPALNNIWPRRWWPPVADRQKPLPVAPDYCGSFFDGLGNRITVHASANPRRTGLEPEIIRDRATGYGIVTFDEGRESIHLECWPRHVDPHSGNAAQYEGWPMSVARDDGDGRTGVARLPRLEVTGVERPVVELLDADGDVIYTRRVPARGYRPPVFTPAPHTLRVGDPDRDVWQEHRDVSPVAEDDTAVLAIDLS